MYSPTTPKDKAHGAPPTRRRTRPRAERELALSTRPCVPTAAMERQLLRAPPHTQGYLALAIAMLGHTTDTRVRVAALGCLAIIAIVSLFGTR